MSSKWLPLKEEDRDFPVFPTLMAGTFQILVDLAWHGSKTRERVWGSSLLPPLQPRLAECLAEQKQLLTPWVSPLSLTEQLEKFTLKHWASGTSAVSYKPLKMKQHVLLAQGILHKGLPALRGKHKIHMEKGPSSLGGSPAAGRGDHQHFAGFQGCKVDNPGVDVIQYRECRAGKARDQQKNVINQTLLVASAWCAEERNTTGFLNSVSLSGHCVPARTTDKKC